MCNGAERLSAHWLVWNFVNVALAERGPNRFGKVQENSGGASRKTTSCLVPIRDSV